MLNERHASMSQRVGHGVRDFELGWLGFRGFERDATIPSRAHLDYSRSWLYPAPLQRIRSLQKLAQSASAFPETVAEAKIWSAGSTPPRAPGSFSTKLCLFEIYSLFQSQSFVWTIGSADGPSLYDCQRLPWHPIFLWLVCQAGLQERCAYDCGAARGLQ